MAIVPCALMLRVNVFPVNGGFLRRRHGSPEVGLLARLCAMDVPWCRFIVQNLFYFVLIPFRCAKHLPSFNCLLESDASSVAH